MPCRSESLIILINKKFGENTLLARLRNNWGKSDKITELSLFSARLTSPFWGFLQLNRQNAGPLFNYLLRCRVI